MKYLLLPFLILYSITFSSIAAQHQVRLTIHHKLGTENFALNQPAVNNLNHAFEFTRNEYYISGISIIDDQSHIFHLDSIYMLVDAAEPTSIVLGNLPINQVTAIFFYVGVDSAHNHLDPAAWDPSHPLAPQFPSMHWGWVSGYRFIALEGFSGPVLHETFQLHGLGDQNYFRARVFVQPPLIGNEIHIEIDADYTRALEDIPLNDGVIVHGDNLEALQCLENFKNLVFSPHTPTTGVDNSTPVQQWSCFPNPAFDGVVTLSQGKAPAGWDNIMLFDAYGRQCTPIIKDVPEGTQIQLPYPGIFYLTAYQKGQYRYGTKVISF